MSYVKYESDENGQPIWYEFYIDFLANPMDNRTVEQFANELNIAYTTIWRYKTKNKDQVNRDVEIRRKKFLTDMRTAAYKSLANKLHKDTNALKLFFQLAGDLVERTEDVTKDLRSPEEKRAEAMRLAAELQKLATKNDQPPESPKQESTDPRPEQAN